MITKIRFLKFLLLFCGTIGLITGCHSQAQADNTIKVGTISGPETQLMEVAKDVAFKKYGLVIKIIEFTDYTMPNNALIDGSIDANAFQHQPYLDQFLQKTHAHLTAIGKTFIYPMGIYSQKIKNLDQIKIGAIVAIPNDPSNEARALLLLSKTKLISLKNNSATATPLDVIANPKNIQLKELDAAQLPRVLPDVTLAAIPSNYAVLAELHPTKDAIVIENQDSIYANLIVVRANDVNNLKLKQLVKAYQSPEVLQAAKELFNGDAIPAW